MISNTEYLRTYKFFDNKNRQLSIFAKYKTNSNNLIVWVFSCSTQDKFSKKVVLNMFEDYLNNTESDEHQPGHPTIFYLPCTQEDSRNTFLRFCDENYWRKEEVNLLITENKIIKINSYYNSTTTRVDNSSLHMRTLSQKQVEYIKQDQMDLEEAYNNLVKGNINISNPEISTNNN